jgi:hypothetical protein
VLSGGGGGCSSSSLSSSSPCPSSSSSSLPTPPTEPAFRLANEQGPLLVVATLGGSSYSASLLLITAALRAFTLTLRCLHFNMQSLVNN